MSCFVGLAAQRISAEACNGGPGERNGVQCWSCGHNSNSKKSGQRMRLACRGDGTRCCDAGLEAESKTRKDAHMTRTRRSTRTLVARAAVDRS